MFDENKLREEIIKIWGEHGAHCEVFDMLIQRIKTSYTREEVYQVAKRSVEVFVGECLTKGEPAPLDKIINNEIDTVKLF